MVDTTPGTRPPARRGGSNAVWGWIIGIIVVIGIIWAIAEIFNNDAANVAETPVTPPPGGEIEEGVVEEEPLGGEQIVGEEGLGEEPMPGEENLGEGTATTPTVGAAGEPTVITEETELAENYRQYLGQSVQITGEVNELIGTSAFTIDIDGIVGGDEALVFSATPDLMVTQGAMVQVTGTVREFNLTDIETEVGYDLNDDVFMEYQNRPVIVATSIQQTAGE